VRRRKHELTQQAQPRGRSQGRHVCLGKIQRVRWCGCSSKKRGEPCLEEEALKAAKDRRKEDGCNLVNPPPPQNQIKTVWMVQKRWLVFNQAENMERNDFNAVQVAGKPKGGGNASGVVKEGFFEKLRPQLKTIHAILNSANTKRRKKRFPIWRGGNCKRTEGQKKLQLKELGKPGEKQRRVKARGRHRSIAQGKKRYKNTERVQRLDRPAPEGEKSSGKKGTLTQKTSHRGIWKKS